MSTTITLDHPDFSEEIEVEVAFVETGVVWPDGSPLVDLTIKSAIGVVTGESYGLQKKHIDIVDGLIADLAAEQAQRPIDG